MSAKLTLDQKAAAQKAAQTGRAITKVVKRVIAEGYEPIPGREVLTLSITVQPNLGSYVNLVVAGKDDEKDKEGKPKRFGITVGLNDMIFSHNFARLLWGEGLKPTLANINKPLQLGWQHHLRQLTMIEDDEDRVAYLAETVPKKRAKK